MENHQYQIQAKARFPKARRLAKNLTAEQAQDQFLLGLRQRYWGEKTLLELLPQLSHDSTSYELSVAITHHESITEKQIGRIVHVFESMEERTLGESYPEMEKLMLTANRHKEQPIGFERDKAIVSACKKIMEHEIGIYKQLLQLAKLLGAHMAEDYLITAVAEERKAWDELTQIELTRLYAQE